MRGPTNTISRGFRGNGSGVHPGLGWHEAEPPAWLEIERRKRRRRLIAYGAVIVLVAAEAVGALVWNAASHYSRGRAALAAGLYERAADELGAARILIFPYRNADELAAKARSSMSTQAAAAAAAKALQADIARLVGSARQRLASGDVAGAVEALKTARGEVPVGPLSERPATRAAIGRLSASLEGEARSALKVGAWKRAALLAAGLRQIDPASKVGGALAAEASASMALQVRLDAARAAAHRGQWRRALALAQAILRSHAGFPGAAALVADARVALAPKPSHTPAAAATQPATTSTSSSGSGQPPPP